MSNGHRDPRRVAFGARVRQLRTARGLTQAELARRLRDLGVGSGVGAIERGQANPTLDTLVGLAIALDVDLGELFTGPPTDPGS